MIGPIELLPVPGLPEIGPGDRLGELIAAVAELRDGDIVVIAQKIVSKAEGRQRRLVDVAPSPRAREIAAGLGKDPRLVELILGETREIVRDERVLIVETVSGLVCANAGIDSSNVPGDDEVLLLPADPDDSARRLRAEIAAASGCRPAVIVADSFGRPWRIGQTDVAIGCAGIDPLDDWRGRSDRDGRRARRHRGRRRGRARRRGRPRPRQGRRRPGHGRARPVRPRHRRRRARRRGAPARSRRRSLPLSVSRSR